MTAPKEQELVLAAALTDLGIELREVEFAPGCSGLDLTEGAWACHSLSGYVSAGLNEPRWLHTFGMGSSPTLARIVAMSEMVERYHFYTARPTGGRDELEPPNGIRRISPLELGISPARLTLLDGTEPGWWRNGRSLSCASAVAVPFEGFHAPRRLYRSTTSGWASHWGDEAIVGGLLEIVERDSLLLAWHMQDFGYVVPPERVPSDVASVGGNNITYLLLKNDLAIHTVLGLVIDNLGHIYMSSGAAASLSRAVRRAHKGVIQKWICDYGFRTRRQHDPVWPVGPGEHRAYYADPSARAALIQALSLASTTPLLPDAIEADGEETLPALCSHLIGAGFEPIIVDESDQALQGTGLRVVRCLVPGLLPLYFGDAREARVSRLAARARAAGLQERARRALDLNFHPFI